MADVVNISPNMNIAVPVPQQSPGPDWAQDIYTALYNVIDQHNHSPGNGVQITPAGININSPLTFQTNNATNMLAAGFVSQTNPLAIANYPASIYVSGGNLYYNSSSTQIQITTPTGVNATSSGISDGTATASFVSGILVVDEAANTPANIQAGSYLLGNNTAGSDFITIAPNGTIPADYTLALPVAPPPTTSIMQMDGTGIVFASNILPGTLQIGSSGGPILSAAGMSLVVVHGVFPGGGPGDGVVLDSSSPNTLSIGSLSTAYPAVVSANTATSGLLIIRGSVSSTGAIISGEGFTVNNFSTGQYTVTFTGTPFLDDPVVVVSLGNDGSFDHIAIVSAVLTNQAVIQIGNTSNFSSQPFNFIAIGQRRD